MIHNDSLRFLAATWLLTACHSGKSKISLHTNRRVQKWRGRRAVSSSGATAKSTRQHPVTPIPTGASKHRRPQTVESAADLCTAIFSKVYFWIDSFEYIFISDTSLRMNCTGTSPAPKPMKDALGNPVPTHVLSEEIPVADIEAGSHPTKCLTADVLMNILFCFHTPDYVRPFSVLSKSHLRTCLPAMKEMCRRRWRTKVNFHARWASAISNSIDGRRFWYRQYFHSGPRMVSRNIKFNDTTATYVRDNPTRTERDRGRVGVNGEMVGAW